MPLLFEMKNEFQQGCDEGICTAAALLWARKCLQLNRGIGSYAELAQSDHLIEAQHAVIKNFDTLPKVQTEKMGLCMVGKDTMTTDDKNGLRLMQGSVANTAPHVAIFWNSFHTMGYRAGKEFDWFDNNQGLYTAPNAGELLEEMFRHMKAYGEFIKGFRVVKLQ